MKSTLLILIHLLFAGNLFAAEPLVAFNGDRFAVNAENHELREVLEEFVAIGVRVKLDPAVRAKVDGQLKEGPANENLATLLKKYSYSVKWEVVEGPLGDLPRLAEIRVSRPGHERSARLLYRKDGRKFAVVRGADGQQWIQDEVLLGVKRGTTKEQFRRIIASLRGVVVGSIPELGIYRVKLPHGSSVPAVVQRLQDDPSIAAAEPNFAVDIPGAENAPGTGIAEAAPGAATPPPVPDDASLVAVMDSGLSPDVALGELVQGRFDATAPGETLGDRSGHGTQMALIVSGAVTPYGAEPAETGVPLLAVRAFDDNGVASSYSLMEGVTYAAENNARVLSLSWGTNTDSAFVERSIQYAQEQNLIVIAAAGNEPTGIPMYPAAYDGVLAVGALDSTGQLWEKSNYGAFIDLTAPGYAAFPVGHEGPPGSYAGTSISTPYVARAISQYASTYPEATNEQITNALFGSLTDAGAKGQDTKYGQGSLDPAALKRFLATEPK